LNEQGKVKTVNPATEEFLNEYQIMAKQQINDKARKARNAFDEWKKDNDKRMYSSSSNGEK
jgi:acyl-CoA reductase-like NAD-dependent aldehyde dehydrogenase